MRERVSNRTVSERVNVPEGLPFVDNVYILSTDLTHPSPGLVDWTRGIRYKV